MTVCGDDYSSDDDYHLPRPLDSGEARSFAFRWMTIPVQKSGSGLTGFFLSSPPLSPDTLDSLHEGNRDLSECRSRNNVSKQVRVRSWTVVASQSCWSDIWNFALARDSISVTSFHSQNEDEITMMTVPDSGRL
jgi:hypothetical protein